MWKKRSIPRIFSRTSEVGGLGLSLELIILGKVLYSVFARKDHFNSTFCVVCVQICAHEQNLFVGTNVHKHTSVARRLAKTICM